MDLPFSTASDHAVCMTLGRYIGTILTSSRLKDPRAPLAQVFEKITVTVHYVLTVLSVHSPDWGENIGRI